MKLKVFKITRPRQDSLDLRTLNTPERIAAACEEHTAFTPESFEDDPSLVVLEVKKVEFDFTGMAAQPRTESIDPERIKVYMSQAQDGVSIDGGKKVYGIREPIVVYLESALHKPRFSGTLGHHRRKAAENCGYKYIIGRINSEYPQLEEHQRIDFLMRDNAHVQNGKPSTDNDIMGSIRGVLQSSTYKTKEKKRLKAIEDKLDEPHVTSEDKKALKDEKKKLIDDIKEPLCPMVEAWAGGRYGKTRRKKIISEEWNNYERSRISKIYVYPKDKWKPIFEGHKKSRGTHQLCKICNSKSSGMHTRQVIGDIFLMIVSHDKQHNRVPESIDVLISVKGCADIEKLFERRLKVAKDIETVVAHRYSDVKLNFLYFGQSLSKGCSEEIGKLYQRKTISKRYTNIINEKVGVLKS